MKPLPRIRVVLCPKCRSLLDKGGKRKGSSIQEEVIRLLKLKGRNAAFDEKAGEIEYDTPHGRIRQAVELHIDRAQCVSCSRSASQYFEAIIQLRGAREDVEKMAQLVVRQIEQKSFVPKAEELKEGIDIYCGSRSEAIAALNSFGLGFRRTEKLAGQKEGRRLYRTTLLVRL